MNPYFRLQRHRKPVEYEEKDQRKKRQTAKTAGDLFLGGSEANAFVEGEVELTFELVNERCQEYRGYRLPKLNNTLYLHGLNVRKIQCLDYYVALKVLHLQNNLIERISGLDHLPSLRILYLQQNLIKHIEGLECCTQLDTLNISNNPMPFLSNLPPSLSTLQAAGNHMSSPACIEALWGCPGITVVDFSKNSVGADCAPRFVNMPSLRVLYLMGNPITQMRFYRRTFISSLRGLTFMDETPVDDGERSACEAWAADPPELRTNEAYYEAKRKYHAAKKQAEKASRESFKRAREERALLRAIASEALLSGEQPAGEVTFDSFPHLPTASRDIVDALNYEVVETAPDLTQDWNEAMECIICQEFFGVGDRILHLPCQHRFHDKCIKPWLFTFSDTCPVCRNSISKTTPEASPVSSPPPSPVPHFSPSSRMHTRVTHTDARRARQHDGEQRHEEGEQGAEVGTLLSNARVVAQELRKSTRFGGVRAQPQLGRFYCPEAAAHPAAAHPAWWEDEQALADLEVPGCWYLGGGRAAAAEPPEGPDSEGPSPSARQEPACDGEEAPDFEDNEQAEADHASDSGRGPPRATEAGARGGSHTDQDTDGSETNVGSSGPTIVPGVVLARQLARAGLLAGDVDPTSADWRSALIEVLDRTGGGSSREGDLAGTTTSELLQESEPAEAASSLEEGAEECAEELEEEPAAEEAEEAESCALNLRLPSSMDLDDDDDDFDALYGFGDIEVNVMPCTPAGRRPPPSC